MSSQGVIAVHKDKWVDSVCKCGHLQSEHTDLYDSPTADWVELDSTTRFYQKGHGSCKKCNCARFTWKSFIEK